MIRDSSRREVPRISSDLTSRSKETEGSPASIFAMRDWLDWRRLARSACVRRRRRRRSRRPMANRALRSIYAASSAFSRRNSWAFPNFQPFASKRRRFASRMVILPQPASARVNDGLRRGACLLGEDLQNHHGVGVQAVHNSPVRPYAFRVGNIGTLTPRDMTGVVAAFDASLDELATRRPARG